MKKYINYILITLLILTIFGCQEEELESREFPRVKTHKVIENGGSSVTFVGEILTEGNSEITEYGFLWGNGNLNEFSFSYNPHYSFDGNIKTGKFSKEIIVDSDLYGILKVKAYARTNDYLVFGDELTFFD